MGEYQHNMSEEKRPPSLLPEGVRLIRITEMIPSVSKGGNAMFTTTVEDVKTKKSMQVWLVAEPKKRWLLKSLLAAVGVPAGQDGVYDWSVTDVIGKLCQGIVEHYKEPWINREGKEVMNDKCRITEFLFVEPGADGTITPEEAWAE